jgi:hypothetical protein
MDRQHFEQAFRNAVFASNPLCRPILWAFLPTFRAFISLELSEQWLLSRYGSTHQEQDS